MFSSSVTSITCTGGICNSGSTCNSGGSTTTSGECQTNEIKNYNTNNCETERDTKKKYCETYNSPGTASDLTGIYVEEYFAKICGKSNIETYTDDKHYYRKNNEWQNNKFK